MPLFRWRAEYSVNNPNLDSHHQKLFEILNNAYENVMNSHEDDCIFPDIDELTEYTKYHFIVEEQHMREKGHPEIDAHIEEHRQFTENISKLRENSGNNVDTSQALIIMLGQWLIHHVLTEDRKYSCLS